MLDDHAFLCLCDRWYETASHELDDIAGWRENASEAFWYRKWIRPEQFDLDTAALMGELARRHQGIDTWALQDFADYVRLWHHDHNARRLPDQAEVQFTFESAMMAIVAVRDPLRRAAVNSFEQTAESRARQPKWDKATNARNKWLYEQCQKLVPYDSIIRELSTKPKSWDRITTAAGVKKQAQAYADRNGLPAIPRRTRGRPKAK